MPSGAAQGIHYPAGPRGDIQAVASPPKPPVRARGGPPEGPGHRIRAAARIRVQPPRRPPSRPSQPATPSRRDDCPSTRSESLSRPRLGVTSQVRVTQHLQVQVPTPSPGFSRASHSSCRTRTTRAPQAETQDRAMSDRACQAGPAPVARAANAGPGARLVTRTGGGPAGSQGRRRCRTQ